MFGLHEANYPLLMVFLFVLGIGLVGLGAVIRHGADTDRHDDPTNPSDVEQ